MTNCIKINTEIT